MRALVGTLLVWALASCQSVPTTAVGTVQVTAADRGVREKLSAIAALSEDIEHAQRYRDTVTDPCLDWTNDLIALGLQSRHRRLSRALEAESQIVRASLSADVDPALRAYLGGGQR